MLFTPLQSACLLRNGVIIASASPASPVSGQPTAQPRQPSQCSQRVSQPDRLHFKQTEVWNCDATVLVSLANLPSNSTSHHAPPTYMHAATYRYGEVTAVAPPSPSLLPLSAPQTGSVLSSTLGCTAAWQWRWLYAAARCSKPVVRVTRCIVSASGVSVTAPACALGVCLRGHGSRRSPAARRAGVQPQAASRAPVCPASRPSHRVPPVPEWPRSHRTSSPLLPIMHGLPNPILPRTPGVVLPLFVCAALLSQCMRGDACTGPSRTASGRTSDNTHKSTRLTPGACSSTPHDAMNGEY